MNIVKKVVNDFLSYGAVQRAYLGVVIREVDSKLADQKGLDVVSGVYIEDMSEGGGGKDAGMRKGDVIIAIDHQPTNTTSELLEIIGQHSPGDVVDVTVDRDGKDMDFQVELRNQSGTTAITKNEVSAFQADLGASFTKVPDDLRNKLQIKNGMQVAEVGDGILSKGGVEVGFIILKINDDTINSLDDIKSAMKHADDGVIRIEGIYPNGVRMNYGFVL